MDAVVDRLQLGSLVDDEFGRRDLAAIVQPARDVQCVPVIVIQPKIGERWFVAVVRGLGEQEA